jgi:tetratricopeptide (TPR) repeat protein
VSLEQAIALHQQGKLAEAELLYRQVLAREPGRFEPHYYLGVLCMPLGRFAEAVAFLQAALQRRDGDVGALINLGLSLRHLGRAAEALQSFDRVVALKPEKAEAHHQRALALGEMGRTRDCADAAVQVLRLQPNHGGALFVHALMLADLGQREDARAAYGRLLALAPNHIDALNNRALLAWAAHDADAALADHDRALGIDPRHVPSLTNRALVLGAIGRAAEALADYERLLEMAPNDAEIWNRRGAMLWALDRNAEALDSFDRALTLRPDFVLALTNRGFLRWVVEKRHDEAKADLARALALAPDEPWLEGELFFLKMQGADWDGFAEGRALLAAGVAAGRPVVRPFAYQAISSNPASLQQCARIFAAAEFPTAAVPAQSAARAQGKIRIGYVSADFREQATAYLMAGVYEAHDRGAFEITAFDNGFDDASQMRARLETAFDRLVPIAALSDAQAAQAVRDAGIDILVNLNGYFGKPRMGVFAQRPAPLQVNYLGFPGTLGAPCMDYIIADRIVIPEGEQRFYDEAVAWLPDSYQANDAKRALPAPTSRAEHGLPPDAFVFCNFNQTYKLAPETFALWLRLLRGRPGSVLWLLHDHDVAIPRLRAQAEQQGVDGARLVFAPMLPLEAHLSRLALADLFLDALPYHAHTTASDALWAGVPLLTCRGTAFPGRVAASLLQAAGMPELITETAADYEALGLALAADGDRLAALRAKLAQTRDRCALFDTADFTRHLEAAYGTMVARQRAGAAPEGFSVPA